MTDQSTVLAKEYLNHQEKMRREYFRIFLEETLKLPLRISYEKWCLLHKMLEKLENEIKQS